MGYYFFQIVVFIFPSRRDRGKFFFLAGEGDLELKIAAGIGSDSDVSAAARSHISANNKQWELLVQSVGRGEAPFG